MDIYIIETKTGTFMSVGESEHTAKINFTISYPSEKIRKIKKYDQKALRISFEELLEEYFE